MNENLVLIGFMGSGKSSVSKALALELDRFLFDSDELIEAKFQMTVREIFNRFGEDFFRREEEKLATCFLYMKNYIISTGGGFVKVKKLDKLGKIVYLKADFDFLKNRLSKEDIEQRPLFNDEKKARQLFNERLALYENLSNLTVCVEGKSIKDIVYEIKKDLKCEF